MCHILPLFFEYTTNSRPFPCFLYDTLPPIGPRKAPLALLRELANQSNDFHVDFHIDITNAIVASRTLHCRWKCTKTFRKHPEVPLRQLYCYSFLLNVFVKLQKSTSTMLVVFVFLLLVKHLVKHRCTAFQPYRQCDRAHSMKV